MLNEIGHTGARGGSPILSSRYTMVMRGRSAIILLEDERLELVVTVADGSSVELTFGTEWIDSGEGISVPTDLWIQTVGHGTSIQGAITVLANAAYAALPLVSTSANACVRDPDLELAYESTPNISQRAFMQQYLPKSRFEARHCRRLNLDATKSFVRSVLGHAESARIRRACEQYRLALGWWKAGQEVLAASHLWMAAEALTKAIIRTAMSRRGLSTQERLAKELGLELKHLDGHVRREWIFHGDKECYDAIRNMSDAFEHGFRDFPELWEPAGTARNPAAGYVRESILDLVDIGKHGERLKRSPFDLPLGDTVLSKLLMGLLEAETDQLAAPDENHPRFDISMSVNNRTFDERGSLNFTFQDHATAKFGDGVVFHPQRYEVWKRN